MNQKIKNTITLFMFAVAAAFSLGCLIGAAIAYGHDPDLAYKMLGMAVSVFIIANIYLFVRFKKVS